MPNDFDFEMDMQELYEECWNDCCGDDYDSFDDFMNQFGY